MKFELEGKELETFKKWNNEHRKTCKYTQPGGFKDSAGARLTFCFMPTGLGVCIMVECACGESINCTDTDDW